MLSRFKTRSISRTRSRRGTPSISPPTRPVQMPCQPEIKPVKRRKLAREARIRLSEIRPVSQSMREMRIRIAVKIRFRKPRSVNPYRHRIRTKDAAPNASVIGQEAGIFALQ